MPRKSKPDISAETIVEVNIPLKEFRTTEQSRKKFEKAMKSLLVPWNENIPALIVIKWDKGTMKEIKISIHLPKTRMMKIYRDYAKTYKRLREEYISESQSEYGAEKHAIEGTLREIEEKEWIRLKPANFKQAMTRIFDRRPLKRPDLKD